VLVCTKRWDIVVKGILVGYKISFSFQISFISVRICLIKVRLKYVKCRVYCFTVYLKRMKKHSVVLT